MNNPMMYSDPDGEFWAWFAGAIVGGYLNGVQANNGQWNPGKWNWEKTWSAVVGGAIGGAAISGTLGNIVNNAGAIKTFLPGIVSGGLNSAFNGSNFLGGAIGGISYSGNLYSNKITSTDMGSTGYSYSINEMIVDDSNTLNEATEAEFSLNTVLKVENDHYKGQYLHGSWHLVDQTSDLSPHIRNQGYSYGGKSNRDLLVRGDSKIWGLTEVVTHKGTIVWQRIYLPKGTFISLEQLDLTMGHEVLHSIFNNARLFDVEEITATNQRVRVHEYFTSRWELEYIMYRKWEKLNLNMAPFNTEVSTFKSFDKLKPKIQPIFNNYLKSTLK